MTNATKQVEVNLSNTRVEERVALVRTLTKSDVKKLSGPDDDVTRSLDTDREWMEADCTSCGITATLARPAKGTNLVSVTGPVKATLEDGSQVMVPDITTAKPSDHIRFECSKCGLVQEVKL